MAIHFCVQKLKEEDGQKILEALHSGICHQGSGSKESGKLDNWFLSRSINLQVGLLRRLFFSQNRVDEFYNNGIFVLIPVSPLSIDLVTAYGEGVRLPCCEGPPRLNAPVKVFGHQEQSQLSSTSQCSLYPES